MKRQTLSRATAATLLGVAVLVGGGKSYASDADDVLATIGKFHAALTALDMAQMDPLWVHDDTVMDKEPLGIPTTLGWQAQGFLVHDGVVMHPERVDWAMSSAVSAAWNLPIVASTSSASDA